MFICSQSKELNLQNALPTLFLRKEKKKKKIPAEGVEANGNENIYENKNEIENGCNTEIENEKYLVN